MISNNYTSETERSVMYIFSIGFSHTFTSQSENAPKKFEMQMYFKLIIHSRFHSVTHLIC